MPTACWAPVWARAAGPSDGLSALFNTTVGSEGPGGLSAASHYLSRSLLDTTADRSRRRAHGHAPGHGGLAGLDASTTTATAAAAPGTAVAATVPSAEALRTVRRRFLVNNDAWRVFVRDAMGELAALLRYAGEHDAGASGGRGPGGPDGLTGVAGMQAGLADLTVAELVKALLVLADTDVNLRLLVGDRASRAG
jgi:hypothetical protein